jgi:Tfp pilus assembly protein PilF
MRHLLVLSILSFPVLALAEERGSLTHCQGKYGAHVISLQGKLLFKADDNANIWQEGHLDDVLCEGSRVKTQPNSRATLRLTNGIALRLRENTIIALKQITSDDPIWLKQLKGFLHVISRTPKRLKIETAIYNAGPEGTEFAMKVDDRDGTLWVYEGGVRVYNAKGEVKLKAGEAAHTQAGMAPQAKIDIRPEDAVNWALYYPALLPNLGGDTGADSEVKAAIADYRHGNLSSALDRLETIPANRQTPAFFQTRATLRLTAGQDEKAQQDIRGLLANNPQDANALALQSVRELTQNRKDEALRLAQQATAANPQSANAYSALSYAEQGRFDLDKAQAAANQAVKLAPTDALAWARKAELELSQGLQDESDDSARKAVALDPGLERTQTIMGFAHLMRMDTEEALESFNKAIGLDSTAPLARLGLGLTKIREGDLEQGREELENAASLDPNNALIRSYLGKAYYEERRSNLADDQFKLAKTRDPLDPTAYFYDAINKQTTNRPVEALHDMQKAIELNDNRAVYRSKLLLDSDLAARSAGLSRTYRNLGFTHLALVEGWKSVNSMPSDYSGHRLLADSYSTRPLYDIARVSEFLQSQLLQPLNMTSVQPQLAERNLLALESTGPVTTAFNEFNPLFTRNRFALQASGLAGSFNTLGDELVHSGLWKNFSYSLGQYHYESDGFRKNNDVRMDLFNGFFQANITPKFNIQTEIRHKVVERGDIDLSADGFFYDNLRLSTNADTYRGGLHYSPTDNSDLIASYIHYEGQNFASNSNVVNNFFSDQGELQYLFRSTHLSTVAGIGFTESSFSPKDQPGNVNKDSHANGYLYTYTHFPQNIDWTLGLSIDSFETSSYNPVKYINPKFGLIWRTTPKTTLRIAAFKSFKRSLLTNQTIEPTQVAGFNQLYDDFTGTIAKTYGFAIDHKFNSNVFAGLEFIARDLSRPVRVEDNNQFMGFKPTLWHEQNYRAYMNWGITDRLALNLSFHLEDFEGDETEPVISYTPFSTATYDTKMGLRFFDPSGFFAHIEGEYVNQRADWPHVYDVIRNEFFLVNTGIGYRLPKRMGLIQVDINNLFDREFDFQSAGLRSPAFSGDSGQPPPYTPARTVFARFTLAF